MAAGIVNVGPGAAVATDAELNARNPWVAASLPIPTMVAMMVAAPYVQLPFYIQGSPFVASMILAPATLSTGHFYAGDYTKGLAIAFAAPAVALGVGWAAQAIDDRLHPCNGFECAGNIRLSGFLTSWLLSNLVIGGWASWDAYQTAQHQNLSSMPASAP